MGAVDTRNMFDDVNFFYLKAIGQLYTLCGNMSRHYLVSFISWKVFNQTLNALCIFYLLLFFAGHG